MYFLIQVKSSRVSSIRWCGIVIAWSAKRPPGTSRSSTVRKYVDQYSSPTASIISTETTASYWPSSCR
jgi:hypothetical protein